MLKEISAPELFPESRMKRPKNIVYTPVGAYVPVYCANCGADGGMCPEENTFMFYLCNPCFARLGPITGVLMMPDEVFWEKVKQEQMAAYGRYLTNEELAAVVEADASPLATLINGRKT